MQHYAAESGSRQATLSMLRCELSVRAIFTIAGLTVVIALVAAFAARIMAWVAGPIIGS